MQWNDMRQRYEELSEAAGRLALALQSHDVPTMLAELPVVNVFTDRRVPHQLLGPGRALHGALAGVPAPARLELIEAVLEDCRPRGRHDPALHWAQYSMSFLTGGLEGADLLPIAEQWFALVERHDVYTVMEPLVPVIRAYSERGGVLSPALVGVIRRTAVPGFVDHDGAVGFAVLVATLTEPPLNPGEAWSEQVLADLEDPPADGARSGPWRRVVAHAASAPTGARPSKAWEKAARTILEEIGPEAVRERLVEWLSLVGRPRTFAPLNPSFNSAPDRFADEYDPCNIDTLRGLIWMLGCTPANRDTADVFGRIVEGSLRKLPGLGPRSVRLASTAVTALSLQDGDAALGELARLSVTVRYKGTLRQITKALDSRAAALGLTTGEVEELSVPSHGLTEPGRRVQQFGDAEAELCVVGTSVKWTWRTGGGKAVKSVPAKARTEYKAELKELKADAAQIAKTLSAHSERLDRQFLARRSWRYTDWRARLADHPLLGTLVRRLIWLVDGVAVSFVGGGEDVRTVDGAALTPGPGPGSAVELWHPIGRDQDEVAAWRALLEHAGVTQPFKQAHREVYVPTPAEEATAVYSNRFAAHLCRQYQFQSLAGVRGWHSKLRMAVDDAYPPAVRQLPAWGLRAEFWVDGVAGFEPGEHLISDSCAYLYLSTDQVRFYRHGATGNMAQAGTGDFRQRHGEAADPLPLAEIPPLVLSEVLRDVDLFVGVSSVGNDPTWGDGGRVGRVGRQYEYWHGYAFGELGVAGLARAELLARLVPMLAVGEHCRIDGRFLEVRGELNTYKIHLGSGNILMEPGSRYLCIVPGQSLGETPEPAVSLPFDGDRMLTLILSKAILLADDTAITDPAIVRQLGT